MVRKLADRVLESGCPNCVRERQIQERIERAARDEQERQERILKHLFQQAAIPERFVGRTFENYRLDANNKAQKLAFKIAKAYADRFEDRLQHGGGLVMCGKPGTGKTHLAVAIANQIIQTRRSAIFMTVYRAIRNILSAWRKDSEKSEQQAIDNLCKPDLLILDEIGVQYGSDSEKIIMFDILNTRYENLRPTILLSNLSKEELTAVLGERVIDRMQEGGAQ